MTTDKTAEQVMAELDADSDYPPKYSFKNKFRSRRFVFDSDLDVTSLSVKHRAYVREKPVSWAGISASTDIMLSDGYNNVSLTFDVQPEHDRHVTPDDIRKAVATFDTFVTDILNANRVFREDCTALMAALTANPALGGQPYDDKNEE